MRGKRVSQQVRVHAFRLEAGSFGEAPQDQERARPGERATLRVEEELWPVALVEERPPVGEVAAQRVRGMAANGDDALLVALACAADQAPLQVYVGLAETNSLADPKPRAVEELDQRAIAHRAWRRAGGGLD